MKKGNFSGRINLLKFKNAGTMTIQGRESAKRCVVIPIEDNHLFVSADDSFKAKACYCDFMAWENEQPGRYGDTHSIRQSLSKEVREGMSKEELNAIPFLGNMKPYESPSQQNQSEEVSAPYVYAQQEDLEDLPF